MYVFLSFLSRVRQTDDGLLLHAHIYPSKKKRRRNKNKLSEEKRNITKKRKRTKRQTYLITYNDVRSRQRTTHMFVLKRR
jgi:hypothetical protein